MIPLVVAGTALSVGKALFKHQQQAKAAAENKRLANAAAMLENQQMVARQSQELQALRQDRLATERQGNAALGVQAVSAGTADTMGTSVDQSAQQIMQSIMEALRINSTNAGWLNQQFGMESQGIRARQLSRIAAVPKPSMLGTALEIGGAFLNGMSQPTRPNVSMMGPTPAPLSAAGAPKVMTKLTTRVERPTFVPQINLPTNR